MSLRFSLGSSGLRVEVAVSHCVIPWKELMALVSTRTRQFSANLAAIWASSSAL
jgi:hypothetical protein